MGTNYLRDNFRDRTAVVDLEPFATRNLQSSRVQAQLLQQRRVNVGHIMPILDRVKPNLVGRAMHHALLQPTPGHPDGEAKDVMIPAIRALRTRGSPKLGGK